MSILRALTPGGRRNFTGPWGNLDGSIPSPVDAGDIGTGGLPVTESTSVHLADAYACITLIADIGSTLPVGAFRQSSAGYPVPTERRLYVQPDPELSVGEFLGQAFYAMACRGEAFLYLYDWRNGYPEAAKVIHPDDITPQRRGGRLNYRLRGGDTLTPNEVLHVQLHPVPGSLRGLSPIEAGARTIRMSTETELFGSRWFADGAAPSSVLETDQPLDDVKARQMQAKWVASHGGRRRPAVLADGLKWRPVTITPNESQFLETRRLNTAQTARLWRVPPHMIGDVTATTSWGTGIEQQGIGFVVYTLGVYLSRLEQALSSIKVSPRGEFARFNVNALLRGDAKTRYEGYSLGRQWGWFSVNDIRSFEDLPPIEGGDTYLQPMNMVDAEQALVQAKLEQDTTPEPDADDARSISVNVGAPAVNVSMPAQRFHVDAPAITVEPPAVTVEPASVRVEPNITVERSDINVTLPNPEPTNRTVERDAAGNITRILETKGNQ